MAMKFKDFKVGDRVIVRRPLNKHTVVPIWVSSMDLAIDQTGTVRHVGGFYVEIDFDNPRRFGHLISPFNYPAECVELLLPTSFTEGEAVIVQNKNNEWNLVIFSHYNENQKLFYSTDNKPFKICVKFKGNEHLIIS